MHPAALIDLACLIYNTARSSLGPLRASERAAPHSLSLPIIILNALTILQSLCVLVNKIELDFGALNKGKGFDFLFKYRGIYAAKKATRTHTTRIVCVSFCVSRRAREVLAHISFVAVCRTRVLTSILTAPRSTFVH
jgi:hypothetical protein